MTLLKTIKILSLSLIFFVSQAKAEPFFTDLKGQRIDFSQFKGRWLLINYWASWCHPCLAEIKVFNKFYQKNKNRLALYAVNYETLSPDEQRDLINRFKIQYPSLLDDPTEILGLGPIRGVPVTFVFNPAGELSKTLYGPQTLASLNEAIEEV